MPAPKPTGTPRPAPPKTFTDNTPVYCSQDGKPLIRRESSIPMGFDPFTGEARPARQHVILRCEANGAHDSWVLSDHGWIGNRPDTGKVRQGW